MNDLRDVRASSSAPRRWSAATLAPHRRRTASIFRGRAGGRDGRRHLLRGRSCSRPTQPTQVREALGVTRCSDQVGRAGGDAGCSAAAPAGSANSCNVLSEHRRTRTLGGKAHKGADTPLSAERSILGRGDAPSGWGNDDVGLFAWRSQSATRGKYVAGLQAADGRTTRSIGGEVFTDGRIVITAMGRSGANESELTTSALHVTS